MVQIMPQHAVIVDVAVDQGGCVATTKETTHSDPVYEKHGIVHYGVANMPGAVPHTSTWALSNATMPYLVELAAYGIDEAATRYSELQKGINTRNGKLANAAVRNALEGDGMY